MDLSAKTYTIQFDVSDMFRHQKQNFSTMLTGRTLEAFFNEISIVPIVRRKYTRKKLIPT